jgi:hypothetical protein
MQQQNAHTTRTNKRLLKINEPTQTSPNNSAFSDGSNKQLDLDVSKESNVLSTLGKSNPNTKVKLHDNVLSNAGDKKGNVDNGTKNSHISHPVKLIRTGHLGENKVSFRIVNVLLFILLD